MEPVHFTLHIETERQDESVEAYQEAHDRAREVVGQIIMFGALMSALPYGFTGELSPDTIGLPGEWDVDVVLMPDPLVPRASSVSDEMSGPPGEPAIVAPGEQRDHDGQDNGD